MTTILNRNLPDELKPFQLNIESTSKSYIEIKATKDSQLNLWQSKFGGFPYLPKTFPYPKDSKNQPMVLLAQINFNETPKLDIFPQSGILQFYISNNDDLYGLNFKDQSDQNGFRVLYFPEIIQDKDQLIVNFDFLPKVDMVPLGESCKLEYSLQHMPVSTVDYHFEEKIFNTNKPSSDDIKYKIYDQYEELFPAIGHKIGGYPFFTQHDPRADEKYKNDNFILLFQMDTDGDNDIMWGDAGVGNFFIREKDLQEKDFSKTLYNWDCC